MRSRNPSTTPFIQFLLIAAAILSAGPEATAQIPDEPNDPMRSLQTVSPKLLHSEPVVPLAEAAGLVRGGSIEAWRRFSSTGWSASVDQRNGLIVTVTGSGLPWSDGESGLARLESLAREFLRGDGSLLGVDPDRLRLNEARSGRLAPHVWAVDFDVLADGDPIEGARVVFRVNSGRLIQFGSENLPSPGTPVPQAVLDRAAAREIVARHLGAGTTAGGFTDADTFLDDGSLHLVPVNLDVTVNLVEGRRFTPGQGRGLARVWQFVFRREGSIGTYRARVDAVTGELLEFADINRYAQATGGVASDTAAGTETVRPMPFADLGGGSFTSSSGLYTFAGTPLTSSLSGQFVRINDSCGGISLTTDAAGELVFGTAATTGCTTPGSGGPATPGRHAPRSTRSTGPRRSRAAGCRETPGSTRKSSPTST